MKNPLIADKSWLPNPYFAKYVVENTAIVKKIYLPELSAIAGFYFSKRSISQKSAKLQAFKAGGLLKSLPILAFQLKHVQVPTALV